ncbi:MAG: hypothetical protein ACR2NC_04480 [Thermodesulfobacteriota bacterium]
MYGKFIGIDLSNNDLKLCAVNRSLREERFESKKRITLPEKVLDSDVELFSPLDDLDISTYDISTAIPTSPISMRVLSFPFKDSKKIKQVYKFELENITTHNPDEKLHSYHLVKLEENSEVLVSMFEKADMESFLEHLHSNGIDPRFVTFSPFAFSSLNTRLTQERPLLLVDISSNEMNFILFDEKGLRRVRSSSNVLANFVTGLGIEDRENFNFYDIEGTKVEKSNFQPLITEIVRTTHFFETELKKEVKSIVITGDVCLLDGVEELISEGLNKPVSKIFISELGEKDSPIYAKSYAIALYGIHSGQDDLNLRINEFEYKGKGQEIRKTFLIPLLLFSVLLIITFYRNISDVMASRTSVKSMQSEMQEEVKEVFPNISVIPDPVSFMEAEVVKVQDKLELIEEVKGGSTPLDVLRDIAITFPGYLNIRVDEIRFESGKRVKIWGRCSSYKNIAAIEKILSDSKRFKDVQRDQVSQSVNNTVKFVISMVVN